MKDTPLTVDLFWTLIISFAAYTHVSPKGGGLKTEIQKFAATAFTVQGCILMLIGIGLNFYQIYVWLRDAQWRSYNAIDALSYVTDTAWLYRPQDWLGIHQILIDCPASLALIGSGIAVTTIAILNIPK